MSDWQFNYNEVIEGPDGYWWHVLNRLEDIDSDRRFYRLGDATHSEFKECAGSEWLEEDFESLGWKTTTKPAAQRGYRVNGVLSGPGNVDYWKDTDCMHDHECPECGADGMGEIDIIHSIEDREVVQTQLECRVCGETWRE